MSENTPSSKLPSGAPPQRTTGGKMKWTAPSPEHMARMLPQYDQWEVLGRGGMGAVYRARQASLDRTVAVKILPPEAADDEAQFIERFKNEARTMAKLMHPAIVAVFDFGETSEGQLYFVMEFVDGSDVSKMIKEQGRLPAEHALAITAHVCDALRYAHEHGVIHRDIKPANVLINTEGAVKVADFGLAKMDDPANTAGLTKSGVTMGTPDFVAPEALTLGSLVDHRADLYAVGVMLYQMLTGKIPRGMSGPPSVVVPGLDPRFDAIVQKAMQEDRDLRYQSAAEIRQALDQILMVPIAQADAAGQSSVAIPRQAVAQKPVARGPRQPEVSPPKSQAPWFIGIGLIALLAAGAFFMLRPDVARHAEVGNQPPDPTSPSESGAATSPAPVAVTPSSAPAEPEVAKSVVTAPKEDDPKPVAVVPAPAMPEAGAPVPVPVPAPVVPPSPDAPLPSPAAKLPAELAEIDAQFIKLQAERVSAPFEADVAKLNTGYLGGVAKKIAEEKAAGNLDGIIALEAEAQGVTASSRQPSGERRLEAVTPCPVPDTDDEKTPASLKALRAIYRDQFTKLAATRAANLKALTAPLDKRLAAMETAFTKADRLADAKSVRGYREVLGESGGADDPPSAAAPPRTALGGPSARPPGAKPLSPTAKLALKDGITNSLGMKFVLVKDTDVLFCIHETRYRDYAAYAAEAPGVNGEWKDQSGDGYALTENKENHPVMKVSWEEAQKFCSWLSKKESKLYRLPTDQEWNYAVGIGRDEKWKKDTTPATVTKSKTDFPWGDKWPPPKGSGNYSDDRRKAKAPNATAQYLENYDDGFPTTAPVMSFKPNKLGLYDLEGNVREWVEDWWDNAKADRALRGGCWDHGNRAGLLSSYRSHYRPGYREYDLGFRCVLVPGSASVSAPPPVSTPPPPPPPPAPVINPAAKLVLKDGITNSLGMKFVLVKDTAVLFCIHETRRQDYAAYANEVPGLDGSWKNQERNGIPCGDKDDHPVVGVSWEDAVKFCEWLSKKEGKTYRLPTDEEWSMAVGLGRKEKHGKGITPEMLNQKEQTEFPWGEDYPPKTKERAGNYADAVWHEKMPMQPWIKGYSDGYVTTAPVMSFKPNKAGLYDMGGNVWEWVEDCWNAEQKDRVLRGASFFSVERGSLLSSYRHHKAPGPGNYSAYGFRCVMVMR